MAQVASTQGCDRDKLGDFCNDDLSHISSRYGVSVKDLLWWNPDLYGKPSTSLPPCLSVGHLLVHLSCYRSITLLDRSIYHSIDLSRYRCIALSLYRPIDLSPHCFTKQITLVTPPINHSCHSTDYHPTDLSIRTCTGRRAAPLLLRVVPSDVHFLLGSCVVCVCVHACCMCVCARVCVCGCVY